METPIWQGLAQLSWQGELFFAFALLVAFGFEFINGFHDTANAVTTVIYTKTLQPVQAVVISGCFNFLGVLVGGTAVAFAIVNLLPVDLLIDGTSIRGIVMVLTLLLAGVIWNLGTWWMGLPVSSSHTLIGSIVGVGAANSVMKTGSIFPGMNWPQIQDVTLSLLISPIIGFIASAILLLLMRLVLTNPRLYEPPGENEEPPKWIRAVLISTCGAVSFAHGSNDGQKGMGLILLILIGFLPTHYALDLKAAKLPAKTLDAAVRINEVIEKESEDQAQGLKEDLTPLVNMVDGKHEFAEVRPDERWKLRTTIYKFRKHVDDSRISTQTRKFIEPEIRQLDQSIEFVPLWVKFGVAVVLGIGTMIGYKRIVVTVAEKIGKTHLTYAQGASAEAVAAMTILLADVCHLPVSTTHVLSSGIAGTMYANRSGLQWGTLTKIAAAWILTIPASMLLAAGLFSLGVSIVPR